MNKMPYRKKKNKLLRGILFLPILLLSMPCFAAEDVVPFKMDKMLWSNGKIYVVVLVIVTIFVGIILTLIYLERKMKKLERQIMK